MPNPKLPGGNFNACVGIMKEKGYSEESAKKICGKLKAQSEGDSLIRNFQLVAKEGVLPYWEDGKIVYKYKPWDSLKKFHEIEVPIVDEHPPGLITPDIPLEGYAKIFADDATHTLYAEMFGVDEMPFRKGYSIGFVFIEREEKGKFNGIEYDSIQDIIKIDHIALTDNPRQPAAKMNRNYTMLLSGDNSDATEIIINKYCVDYHVDLHNRDVDQHNGSDTRMSSEENVNTQSPAPIGMDAMKEITELRAKIAQYEAEKKAADSYKEQLDSLKTELDKIKEERDSLKKIFEERREAELNKAKDSLVKAGLDAKDLEGKTYDYIMGRYEQLQLDSKKTPENIEITPVNQDSKDDLEISYFRRPNNGGNK